VDRQPINYGFYYYYHYLTATEFKPGGSIIHLCRNRKQNKQDGKHITITCKNKKENNYKEENNYLLKKFKRKL
jgi:hypothetical protein